MGKVEKTQWTEGDDTLVLPLNVEQENLDDMEVVDLAATYLARGNLVSFPTETVYGLGGDGLSPEACLEIFRVKQRPADNPLILHVDSVEMAKSLVSAEAADLLEAKKEVVARVWPGPLTLIFNRSELVPDVVTAGGPTVAIRMPKHPIALALIGKLRKPIAAPSANRSGRPSPTNAQDVYEDLAGSIPLIIDGGPCDIGIESTVVDITGDYPVILRPGFYTKEILEGFWGHVDYEESILGENQLPKSPGQKYRHYAPRADMKIFVGDMARVDDRMQAEVDRSENRGKRIAALIFEENEPPQGIDDIIIQSSITDPEKMSHNLFSNIRELDRRGADLILAVGFNEDQGLAVSIMNRMRKSASNQVIIC